MQQKHSTAKNTVKMFAYHKQLNFYFPIKSIVIATERYAIGSLVIHGNMQMLCTGD